MGLSGAGGGDCEDDDDDDDEEGRKRKGGGGPVLIAIARAYWHAASNLENACGTRHTSILQPPRPSAAKTTRGSQNAAGQSNTAAALQCSC